jgi:hypothetical protein
MGFPKSRLTMTKYNQFPPDTDIPTRRDVPYIRGNKPLLPRPAFQTITISAAWRTAQFIVLLNELDALLDGLTECALVLDYDKAALIRVRMRHLEMQLAAFGVFYCEPTRCARTI